MRVSGLHKRISAQYAAEAWRLRACKAVHSHRGALPQIVFPHNDIWSVEGSELSCSRLIDILMPSTSEDRLQKMQQVIDGRSYNVVPVVEGLYDMGNLAAVCRSADAMGFGAVHCIMRPTDKYKKSQRTAAGADKWLDTKLWNTTEDCLGALKGAGYQVVVTHLSASSITVQEVDWTRPTAFVLGNERSGVSDTAVQLADHTAIIPMAGFVESFNISVAAALIMYEAQQQRIRKLGKSGDLTEQQKQQLLASFLLRGVKNSRMMVGELLHRPPPAHQKRFFRNKQQEQQEHNQQQQQGLELQHEQAATMPSAAEAAEDGAWEQNQPQHSSEHDTASRRLSRDTSAAPAA